MKWDKRFLKLAEHIASWSKDPSTKCGAVITRDKRIISQGFNGFPEGVNDSIERLTNRELKYKMVIHSEVNAILYANCDLTDCTIYVWPMPPCSRCACQIIQSGIKRIVTIEPTSELAVRWGEDMEVASTMYLEAGVMLDFIDVF